MNFDFCRTFQFLIFLITYFLHLALCMYCIFHLYNLNKIHKNNFNLILSMALKRITKQWNDCQKDPIPGIKIFKDQVSPFLWTAIVDGGQNSPYQGGKFHLKINIPNDYPFKPPQVVFKTKVYHPGVYQNGHLCCCYVDMVTTDGWSPALTIQKVLKYYQYNLTLDSMNGLNDCGANPPILDQFKKQRHKFQQTARQWTKKYANKDQTGVGPEQNKCLCCLSVIYVKEVETPLRCGHRFHYKCLKQLDKNLCPICQEEI